MRKNILLSTVALFFVVSQVGCVASRDDVKNLESKIDKIESKRDESLKTKHSNLPQELCLFNVVSAINPDYHYFDEVEGTQNQYSTYLDCPMGYSEFNERDDDDEWTKGCRMTLDWAMKKACSNAFSSETSEEDESTLMQHIKRIGVDDGSVACYLPCDMVK